MAFPTTGLLDDFNRGTGIGSNWTTGNTYGDGATAWTIVSNQAAPSSEYTDGTWTVANYGPDCEVYATIPVLQPQDRFFSLFLRHTGVGTTNTDGYVLEMQIRPGNENWRMYRVDNRTWTQIGTTDTSKAIAAGDKMGFEAVGSTLTAYVFQSGAWAQVFQVTDTTYNAAGRIGMGQFANANTQLRVDDFSGGTITSGSTPISGSDSATGTDAGSVSATVSGSQTATGTDAGAVSATIASSDTGTGTDGQALTVMPSSADSGTGTEAGTVQATGSSVESGGGSDSGSVSATLTGADAGTATDAGTVADITGGPDLISGSDSGSGTDSGVVTDLTPPPEEEEDLGDVSSIYGVPPRHLADSDHGVGFEGSSLVDLTPRKPLTIKLPEKVRKIFDGDAAVGTDGGSVGNTFAATDSATAFEGSDFQVTVDTVADADDGEFLMVLGLLSD